jgi:hypothetical protein
METLKQNPIGRYRLLWQSTCLVLACWLWFFPPVIQSEPPVIVETEWHVSPPPEGGWTVGDQIPLSLSVTYPPQVEIALPQLPRQWGAFEVLAQETTPPEESASDIRTAALRATVTLWQPGTYQTPPLTLRYQEAGEIYTTMAPSLAITITSVLEGGETEKRDLKPQASLPRPPRWPWFLGGILLTLLISSVAVILWRRRQRSPLPSATPAVETRSPAELAYAELERIAELDLVAQEAFKLHYTLIADCIRTYVQGRYGIPALDRTTYELLTAMRQAPSDSPDAIDPGHISLFHDLLTEADAVKFAKLRPPIQQAWEALSRARHIVDVTRPAPAPGFNAGSEAPSTTVDSSTARPR